MADNHSSKQVGIMMFFMILSTKLLTLPSLYYQFSGSKAILSVFLGLIFDFLTLLCVYNFAKSNPNKSFYEILQNKFGKITAKIIYTFIFLFFLIKLILMINGGYTYIRDSVFANSNIFLFLSIFLIVINYLSWHSNKAFGRSCEFFFPFTLILLIICICLGAFSKYMAFVRINFIGNYSSVLTSNISLALYFGDPLFLLLANEKTDLDKGFKSNIFKYSIIGYLIVFIIYFIFYGIYGPTAIMHKFVLGDIIAFSLNSSDFGRLDIVPVITILIVIYLQAGILYKCCFKSLYSVIKLDKKPIIYLIFNILIVFLLLFIFTSVESVLNFNANFFKWVALFVVYFIPLLALLIKNKKEKTYEENN